MTVLIWGMWAVGGLLVLLAVVLLIDRVWRSLRVLDDLPHTDEVEDYVADIRDCTCVWPRTTTDASHIGDLYCPRHGVTDE